MSSRRTGKRSRSRPPDVLQKPRGTFHPRVQKVGPEHFGIAVVDCAKARFKWMLCDFYGNILVPPVTVDHNRPALDEAIAQLRQAVARHDLKDLLVAVERTGRYHHVPQRAFAAAGFETRIVHPFATAHHRQPADADNKTDDTDLVAMHRATVSGFALAENGLDEQWKTLQLLERHRRDLVFKTSLLCCQIREHLDAALPGFAACFGKLWDSACAWHLVAHFAAPRDLHDAGPDGLARHLDAADVAYHTRTIRKVLDWAGQAAAPDVAAAQHRRIALSLNDDRTRKTQEILGLERELAAALVRTPYVLLLVLPGINVVSAADLAGEMGPIAHYANAKAITGRAGLCPSRYQSDRVDKSDGPLRRRCNRRLRAALLGAADSLVLCNHHFQALATRWRGQGKEEKDVRVRVAARFARIAYQLVAGRQPFRHPAMQDRHYVLHKLTAFHREHDTEAAALLRDLEAAVAQLPRQAYQAEAAPLHEELNRIHNGGRRGPQLLGDILPIVLARLGVGRVESTGSGEAGPTKP
jgi:transposase